MINLIFEYQQNSLDLIKNIDDELNYAIIQKTDQQDL